MGEFGHRSVLLSQAVEALSVKPDGIYVDGTFGRGGHAEAVLARLGPEGRLWAFDQDPQAIAAGHERFVGEPRLELVHANFDRLEEVMNGAGLKGRVDGILLDLGVSSPQIDEPARGFSFSAAGPLDMRMDPTRGVSAAQWLAGADEAEISQVLRDLGEERFHRRIARAIVAARGERPIETTDRLAELVAQAIPYRDRHKHPATRTFQAIRLRINHELEALQAVLEQSLSVLALGGRLVVISFHSLEDRIVKRFMRDQARGERLPAKLPVTGDAAAGALRIVIRQMRADAAEVAANPRARSAVLRAAERVASK